MSHAKMLNFSFHTAASSTRQCMYDCFICYFSILTNTIAAYKAPSSRGGIWLVIVNPLTPRLCKYAAALHRGIQATSCSRRSTSVGLSTNQVSTPWQQGKRGDNGYSVITHPSNGEVVPRLTVVQKGSSLTNTLEHRHGS